MDMRTSAPACELTRVIRSWSKSSVVSGELLTVSYGFLGGGWAVLLSRVPTYVELLPLAEVSD